LLSRLRLKSEFSKNVLTLMTGTTIAQAVPIAISPILTRVYTPEDFGMFALYMSVASIFAVIATGRYELAIMLPERDDESVNVLGLSLSITLIVTLFVTVGLVLAYSAIRLLSEGELNLGWLFFMPFTVLFAGVLQSLNFWFIRKKKFKILSTRQILQTVIMVTVQLTLGLFFHDIFKSFGLILGFLTGQVIATGLLLLQLYKEYFPLITHVSKEKIIEKIKRYLNFPKYSLLADLINVVSNQIPVIILSSFFGGAVAGFYSLTQRVLGLPISLISGSISSVFKQKASYDYAKNGNCKKIYLSTLKTLTIFSFPAFIVFFFAAPFLFSIIFGESWAAAGHFAQFLSLMYFFRFISSPLGDVMYIAEKQSYDLIWQISLLVSTASSFLLGILFDNVDLALIIYSVTYSLLYIVYLFISYHFAKGNKSDRV